MVDHTSNPVSANGAPANVALVGVDWGTSSFRLYVFAEDGRVLSSEASADGVKTMARDRLPGFLESRLRCHGVAVNVPVLMSGMVGSTIGWQAVPYLDCPTGLERVASALVKVAEPNSARDLYIVPGLRVPDPPLDVMRGEEVQVMGWWASNGRSPETLPRQDERLCLPGTHSKWVDIDGSGNILKFETAMTGEMFEVLRRHSVLVQGEQNESPAAFEAGVADSENPSLLRALFGVRSRVVGAGEPAHEAESYLSGLLIGAELRSQSVQTLHLVGTSQLVELYARAASHIGIAALAYDGADMTARGFAAIWEQQQA
jgi:2-dehydro-3-deoxygalactonokinase